MITLVQISKDLTFFIHILTSQDGDMVSLYLLTIYI